MIQAVLSGCSGAMGKTIAQTVENRNDIQIVCGIDKNQIPAAFPVLSAFDEIQADADVIIDFSHPSVLDSELEFARSKKLPVVLAATGYTAEQIERIHAASQEIPIFFTANMSLGINLMNALCQQAAALLYDSFDIEIIEKHHNQKVDAPSGTALLLADGINEATDNGYSYRFDRHSRRQKRESREIGISSVRGGTIVGEHTVLFAGNQETLEITHAAFSKQVFANGAVKAAKWLVEQPAGLYDMKNLIKNF